MSQAKGPIQRAALLEAGQARPANKPFHPEPVKCPFSVMAKTSASIFQCSLTGVSLDPPHPEMEDSTQYLLTF